MADLHLLIVVDSETGSMRTASLEEAPTDSRECVWDADNDEWRRETEEETRKAIDAEHRLIAALDAAGLRS